MAYFKNAHVPASVIRLMASGKIDLTDLALYAVITSTSRACHPKGISGGCYITDEELAKILGVPEEVIQERIDKLDGMSIIHCTGYFSNKTKRGVWSGRLLFTYPGGPYYIGELDQEEGGDFDMPPPDPPEEQIFLSE